LPTKKLCFGFIDGNHSPDYVESDFYLVWNKLSTGGAISFHDCKFNLPYVTKKIDELIKRHEKRIKSIMHDKERKIITLIKE
jgi:hypothetical protein